MHTQAKIDTHKQSEINHLVLITIPMLTVHFIISNECIIIWDYLAWYSMHVIKERGREREGGGGGNTYHFLMN